MKLTSTQEKIVNTKGNLIVRASAGTGKTYIMVTKIAKELEANTTHKVIAAITFTIKAAQEIKDRLAVDITQQFIGTNTSFVVEEIIKPFMKDVYGTVYDIDMSTDYTTKVNDFTEGLEKIRLNATIHSYEDNKENFVFELAKKIVEKSEACRLYLTSKYFKIYIDEYQDCDKAMHAFFMYLCDDLDIETFVVGDEKQSIYMWRGAYPEAFTSIWEKDNFEKIFMADNFRSCQQIQNYTNLLCEETRNLYVPIGSLDNIILISYSDTVPWTQILTHINPDTSSALLRLSNNNAKEGASSLSSNELKYVYIPAIPISEIATETAWLYMAIANFCILEHYSVYNLISEIPVEADESNKRVKILSKYLDEIKLCINDNNESNFNETVKSLSEYLGYSTKDDHIIKLFQTIIDSNFHVAFEAEKYNHVAITFHSSKGLEFDQVILFTEDYPLYNMSSVYNHYVAATRAKNKLIIVRSNKKNSKSFAQNLKQIFAESNLEPRNLISKG